MSWRRKNTGSKNYEQSIQSFSRNYTIPNKWLAFNQFSRIINNKFVAFKTPLDSKYDHSVPAMYRFNTNMLFTSMAEIRVNIGLWIDLTNTDRYYDKLEIRRHNCCYVKLPLVGHGTPPTKNEVDSFINICRDFINRYSQLHIGVHCTHGLNRTGFLIVACLVKILHHDVHSAICEFAAARPPGIYRQKYLDELYYRYSA